MADLSLLPMNAPSAILQSSSLDIRSTSSSSSNESQMTYHHRTSSVVPICSQPFEPSSLIGRDPISLSACRRAHYEEQERQRRSSASLHSQYQHHEQRIVDSRKRGSMSSDASSVSSSSSASSSSGPEQAGLRHHGHIHTRRGGSRVPAPLAENELEDDATIAATQLHQWETSGADSSASSSPSSSPISLASPLLYEAHLHYSRGLFDHTARMWEADRLAIERSRDHKSSKDQARLHHVLNGSASSSSSRKTAAASGSAVNSSSSSSRRRASEDVAAAGGSFASRLSRGHRRGRSSAV